MGLVRQQAGRLLDVTYNRMASHTMASKLTDLILPGVKKHKEHDVNLPELVDYTADDR